MMLNRKENFETIIIGLSTLVTMSIVAVLNLNAFTNIKLVLVSLFFPFFIWGLNRVIKPYLINNQVQNLYFCSFFIIFTSSILVGILYNNPFIISNLIDRIFLVILSTYFVFNIRSIINLKITNKRELFILWLMLSNVFFTVVGIINGNSLFYVFNDFIVYSLIPLFYFASKTKVKDIDFEKLILSIVILQSITLLLHMRTFYSADILVIAYLLYKLLRSNGRYFRYMLCLLIIVGFTITSPFSNKSLLIQIALVVTFLVIRTINLKNILKLSAVIAVLVVLIISNYEKIQSTSSYQKMQVFIMSITSDQVEDTSTNGRLYEIETVVENFNSLPPFQKVVGEGNGATLDFTTSPDIDTLINVYGSEGISNVHNIHVIFFSLLNRHGILGIVNLLLLITTVIYSYRKSKKTIRSDISFIYAMCCIFDSFTAATHLFVNLIFMVMFTILITSTQRKGCSV